MEPSNLADAVGHLSLFADTTRVRLMALLDGAELTVAELTLVTGLAQSRVSSHLGKLREAGLLRVRRAGTKTFYALSESAPAGPSAVWGLLRAQTRDAVLEGDLERRAGVLAARERSGRWPDDVAGQMERHYSPGRTWESLARGLVGLVRLGDVLDVGCGDGALAQLLVARARSYTGVDIGERLVAAAAARVGHDHRARFVAGDMHALPFEDGRFDHVMLFHVLSHSPRPRLALREGARVLRPGGSVTVITLAPHDHADVTRAYGHVGAGIAPARLEGHLLAAGLDVSHVGVVARERRPPHFEIVTAFADKPGPGDNA